MTWREVETIKSNKFMMVSRAQTDLRRFVMMDDTNEDNSGIFCWRAVCTIPNSF